MNKLKFLFTAFLVVMIGCQTDISGLNLVTATPVMGDQINNDIPSPQNTSSITPSKAELAVTWPVVSLVEVITGVNQPLHITHAGDGSGRLFIVEKGGRIKIFITGTYQTTFLDIHTRVSTGSEQGLLSVAFPPNYASKGYFYVNYTNVGGDSVIARYKLTADPNLADPTSEEIILTIDQPYSNHNGGQMAFGPDGYLYIGMGDGGSGGDPGNRAQDPAELLGKILRIAVEPSFTPIPPPGSIRSFMPVVLRSGVAASYQIPYDNPFVNTAGYRSEIWALGLRNPWRFSFDRTTGDLYIADVGQNAWEEVDYQPSNSTGGENYGWRILEGNHCYNPSSGCVPPSGYSAPILEYSHGSNDCSITGGFVYRGDTFPGMQGMYFYGDFCSGKLWAAINDNGWQTSLLTTAPFMISSFGEDEAGELYLAGYSNGKIYRLQGD